MPLLSEHHDLAQLDHRLHQAYAVTPDLMSEVVGETCRRFPSKTATEKGVQMERLIKSGAWTDAALALIELELPQWQLRRIAYDEGEWYCALSRERELPEWLDQSVETHHPDLSLAILSAFVEARRNTAPSSRTSVPAVTHSISPLYEPVCSDNFA
jgi:hypothetical protein